MYYVGKVLQQFGNNNYEIDFYRQYRKMPGRFTKPPMEDLAEILRNDIIMVLPEPTSTGGTKRVASMLQFPVDLQDYNCQ